MLKYLYMGSVDTNFSLAPTDGILQSLHTFISIVRRYVSAIPANATVRKLGVVDLLIGVHAPRHVDCLMAW
jgi:hypothetical protein